MLVNPILIHDPQMEAILDMLGQGGKPDVVEQGIIKTNNFSLGNLIHNKKNEYFDFQTEGEEYLGSYGVCDSIEQVKEKYKKFLDDPDLKFCISFTWVSKEDQPEDGGWRWHKWGEYIGTKEPMSEYLHDEGADIEGVFVFHIYELN